ncbi:autotransporter domain-containing protein [Ancylobacter sp. IITR112]|uniref:autotransporter domain-containing protein n=1 Tax=Ancylobacter sp. IITR112 TaxID=3138073 RepID=UPI003529F090
MVRVSFGRAAASLFPRRHVGALAAVACGAFAGALAGTPAGAIYLNDVDAEAVGGVENWYDSANHYPNVVSLSIDGLSHCTGTLINSRTVLTAGHCVLNDDTGHLYTMLEEAEIRFSPDSPSPTANDRALTGVAVNPAYVPFGYPSNDVALISLARPVTEIAPVTLATSPEQMPAAGEVVWLAGYGEIGTGTASNLGYDERRRAVASLLGTAETLPDGTLIFDLQFRDPLNPDDPNYYGLTAPVPAWQGTGAPGDSGGPLFMVGPGGERIQIGVMSTGGIEDPDNPGTYIYTYGSFATYGAVSDHAEWLAALDPLRATTAAAGAFAWSEAANWTDTQGRHEVPDNGDGNFDGYGNLGRYYEVTLAQPSQIRLDMSPTIDRLTLAHAGAGLDIAAERRLDVLLDTVLIGGGLHIDGALTTARLLQAGGVLSGTGTLGAAGGYVQTGGALAPGTAGALGTLVLTGDYRAEAEARLDVRLGTAGVDRLAVSGTASLGGTLAYRLFDPAPFGSYTMLTAGAGVEGEFAALEGPASAFAAVSAVTGDDAVSLVVAKSRSFASAGLTANQRALGAALDALGPGEPLVASAAWLPSLSAARGAFDRLSGQSYASLETLLLQDSRFARAAALDRLRAASGAGGGPGAQVASYADDGTRLADAASGSGAALWLQGFGSFGTLDSAGAALSRDIGGFHAGLDRLVFGDWRLGAFGGYSHSALGAGSLAASWGVDSYTLGLYGGRRWGPLALSLGGAYGWNNVAASRSLALPGLPQTLTADFSTGTAQLFGEIGYEIALAGARLEPFAGLAYVALEGGRFRETGGAAALAVSGADADASFGTLGARFSLPLATPAGVDLRVDASAAWQHVWGGTPTLAAAFAGAPSGGFASGPVFAVSGAPLAQDTALLEAGLVAQAGADLELGVRYTGQFGDGLRDNGFQASLRLRF